MARTAQTKTAQGFVPFSSVAIAGPSGPAGAAGESAPARPETAAPDSAPDALGPSGSEPALAAAPASNPFDGGLAFQLLEPREVVKLEREGAAGALQPAKQCDLVALGACVPGCSQPLSEAARLQLGLPEGSYVQSYFEPNIDMLLEFARQSGPIFGQDDGSEALRDWGRAADAAMLASRIQEFVNGKKSLGAVSSLGITYEDVETGASFRQPRISKMRFARAGARSLEESFALYLLDITPTGQYRDCFSRLPFVQRVGFSPSGHLYAFAQWDPLNGNESVAFCVACFPHEVSIAEFGILSDYLALSDELTEMAYVELGLADAEEAEAGGAPGTSDTRADGAGGVGAGAGELISAEDAYDAWDEDLVEADVDVLAALVRTMILAHLGGARIDPFQSSEATGNHSFDTLLSWLWYDFSGALSRVSIGYCEYCNRPFSKVGHRGIDRRFCSQKCKTAAKNERTKARRDAVRTTFAKNPQATVEDIAREVYESTSKDNRDRVVESLSSWVALKGELEDEIERDGFGGSALFARCVRMGLDMKKLLNARRWHELSRMMSQRR